MSHRWDFFIAHAGADTAAAEELYGYLISGARVFLDSRSLRLGDDWDRTLQRALEESQVTVVLVSANTDAAYYQREEIAAAIGLARRDPDRHRVVPVFLGAGSQRDRIPYGLGLKHGIATDEVGGLAEVAHRLLQLKSQLQEAATGTREAGIPLHAVAEPSAPESLRASVTGFVGPTERGPLHGAPIESWEEFRHLFGEEMNAERSFLPFAIRGFFENGGRRAFVSRVLGAGASSANLVLTAHDDRPALQITALTPGAWGNRLHVRVQDATRVGVRLTISLSRAATRGTPAEPLADDSFAAAAPEPEIQEDYDNLGFDPDAPNFLFDVIERESRLVRIYGLSLMWNRPRNTAAWLTGGFDGAPAGASDLIAGSVNGFASRTGLAALEEVAEISLLCVPDQVNPALDRTDRQRISDAILEHCERLQRFAIFATESGVEVADLPPPLDTSYGAMYFPWLRVPGPADAAGVLVPPVGHLAGVYARVDASWGVHRAPIAQAVQGLVGADERPLEFEVSPEQSDRLQRLGINALCETAHAGGEIRTATAITMSVDSQSQHLGARRFTLMVMQAIQLGTAWVRLERNDEQLWETVRRNISDFLLQLWHDRALLGATAEEAFFVRCDRTTMTEDDLRNGRLVCVIGLSLVEPATSVGFIMTVPALPLGAEPPELEAEPPESPA